MPVVGYVKSSDLSQIDKCVSLIDRLNSAQIIEIFKGDKVELAVVSADTRNKLCSKMGGGTPSL